MKIEDFSAQSLQYILSTISIEMQRLPQINGELVILLQRLTKSHK